MWKEMRLCPVLQLVRGEPRPQFERNPLSLRLVSENRHGPVQLGVTMGVIYHLIGPPTLCFARPPA